MMTLFPCDRRWLRLHRQELIAVKCCTVWAQTWISVWPRRFSRTHGATLHSAPFTLVDCYSSRRCSICLDWNRNRTDNAIWETTVEENRLRRLLQLSAIAQTTCKTEALVERRTGIIEWDSRAALTLQTVFLITDDIAGVGSVPCKYRENIGTSVDQLSDEFAYLIDESGIKPTVRRHFCTRIDKAFVVDIWRTTKFNEQRRNGRRKWAKLPAGLNLFCWRFDSPFLSSVFIDGFVGIRTSIFARKKGTSSRDTSLHVRSFITCLMHDEGPANAHGDAVVWRQESRRNESYSFCEPKEKFNW